MIPTNMKIKTKLSFITRKETETKVQENLAITPSKMLSLAQQGMPISNHNLPADYFNDGDAYADNFIPVERQRGAGLNECWEATKTSEQKFNAFKKASKKPK